jgi:hypothetical protein
MIDKICKQDTGNILLVEGTTDCHVVMALCNAHAVPQTFGLYDCGSDTEVLKKMNALIVRPEPPKVIGVMMDADQPSVAGRWASIRDKLINNGHSYDFPAVPDAAGTILESIHDKPRIGFWLMPNNQSSGMLEDFCTKMAEQNALAFAKECVEGAKQRGLSSFKEVHLSKAIIHTYLAWRDEPGRPLGQAITMQALKPHTSNAVHFVEWLNRLFNAGLRDK